MLPNRSRACLPALLAALAQPLEAAEWSLEPTLSVRTRYDDNFRLGTRNELAVWETSLLPKLTFARKTELSQIEGIAGFNLRRFDEEGLDTNDRFMRFNSSRASERSRWGLNGEYTQDSTLDSELVEEERFFDRVPRERLSLSPSWSRLLTETTSLSASYRLVDVSYPDAPNDQQFIDYRYHTGSLNLGYQLSMPTRLMAQLSLSRSDRENDTLSTDSQQLSLGLEHQFSERLSSSLLAGYGRTDTDYLQGFLSCSGVVLPGFLFGESGSVCVDPITLNTIPFTLASTTATSSSTNTVFSGDLSYRLETGELSVQASRSITPYTNGGLVLNDRVGLKAVHRFSSQLQGSLSLDWYKTGNTDDAAATLDRATTSIRPSLRWDFDPDWSLAATYRYFRQEYEGRIEPATSNSVELTLSYRWPKYAVSR